MRLSIAIPEAQVVEAPALLRLVRMAPTCDVEAGEQGVLYIALFEDFPKSAELVVRLIEKAWDLRDVLIRLDGRSVRSRINFYVALLCYRRSLDAPDPVAHCLRQSAKVRPDGGCPDRSCLSNCQFICSRCAGVSRGRHTGPVPMQLMELARNAEVDWCPNLRIEKSGA
ncbi:MAG: hypothetical protein CV088_01410 [Nitrospira sp. LK70]|nr:hypothetical protein [Nitrospira sp. LK70]